MTNYEFVRGDLKLNEVREEQYPKVSVIVPVYNTEQYLKRCLDSIINQTYRHLEIIVVNDCSPGNVKSMVSDYQLIDDRIKYVEHERNKGLFHARLTGAEKATGEYIAFVDSDDYISIDYYRLLVEKAIEEEADIVEGRIIREHEDGYKFIQNNNNILFDQLTGERIREEFFSQEGLFYHWHVIWNKIYKKSLWDECVPYYEKQSKHLIMTEDLVFSSVLFCNAKKYCSIKYDGYFYCIRAEASTGSDSDLNKFLKNFSDMGTAFDFVESYLEVNGLKGKYGTNLLNWKKSYFRLWANRIKSTGLSVASRVRALDELKLALKIETIEPVQEKDHYHGLINTPWEHKYETLKKKIADVQHEVISFDVFDTLIVRPFWDPRDLLIILDDYFHSIHPENKLVEFSDIRLQAEEEKRRLIKLQNPSWQDINLDEIYEYIYEEYGFPLETINKLKAKEIELELNFVQARKSVYELYKMAKTLGKRIIFVSDMYLPKSVIEEMLNKTGYRDYERLYVSSEARVLKHTGDLFKLVQEEMEIDPDKILHMGDNWQSDVVMAKKSGWHSFFIPKTIDLLRNNLSDKDTGNSLKFFGTQVMSNWESFEFPQYFSTRCMLALVANKIFDHPYPSFNADTDFNADPYYIGYYALGMHTFGLAHWLVRDAINKQYRTIHFMARDGHLPYQVYNILAEQIPGAPRSNYIYASRRSMLPSLLVSHSKYGLDDLVSIRAHTPKSILELFKDIVKDDFDEATVLEAQGIILTKHFSSKYEFKKFIDIFVQNCVDSTKLQQYIAKLRKYFEMIGEHDATFDLGYSARIQTMLIDIIGHSCDAYFVHTSSDKPWNYSRRNQFEISSFYNQKPLVSGILREHLFAELGPSCIGYDERNGNVVPIFEPYVGANEINRMMVQTLQCACLDFARDMVSIFGRQVADMKIRNEEVSIPLEMYIHHSKPADRSIFAHSYSDDFVHGGNDSNSILLWWNEQTNRIKTLRGDQNHSPQYQPIASHHLLFNRGRATKVIYYALFDRDTLKKKVKERYRNRKVIFKIMTVTYRALRSVKRTISK